jgi:hypothetical protein
VLHPDFKGLNGFIAGEVSENPPSKSVVFNITASYDGCVGVTDCEAVNINVYKNSIQN